MTHPAPQPLAAAVLLAGGLKPSPLVRATGRSTLDLYLTATRTVLALWLERLAEVAPEPVNVPTRVLYDAHSPAPTRAALGPFENVEFLKQSDQYRGPAGAVKDASSDIPHNACMVVCDAGRYFHGSLAPMLAAHQSRDADITVGVDENDEPAGVYILRAATLELAPAKGFLDLKEQFLGKAVAAGLNVRVHRFRRRTTCALRTRTQFLAAAAVATSENPVAPNLREPRWNVVAPDADVEEGAYMVDSIAMPGARLEAGCVVARSIICPGARVERGAEVVDAVVSVHGIRWDEEPSYVPHAHGLGRPAGFGR